jgi:putative transposase
VPPPRYVRAVARLPRNVLPREGVYHVTTRGVARLAISRDDQDRRRYLVLLARAVRRENWHCYAFCLMPNHHHLIVETSLARLSSGMHGLNGVYAQEFNERHRRSGHLFGGRFAAFAIESDDHLMRACEYVFQNPVRAGLCEEARDWRWSGTRWHASILRPRAAAA